MAVVAVINGCDEDREHGSVRPPSQRRRTTDTNRWTVSARETCVLGAMGDMVGSDLTSSSRPRDGRGSRQDRAILTGYDRSRPARQSPFCSGWRVVHSVRKRPDLPAPMTYTWQR